MPYYTVEELEKLLQHYGYTWERFEGSLKGRIQVWDLGKPRFPCFITVKSVLAFYLRVGLHMNRPMQAIMADNQFVRLRAAPHFEKFILEKLDPACPNGCLYKHPTPGGIDHVRSWMPIHLKNDPTTMGQAQSNAPIPNSTFNRSAFTGIGRGP